MPAMVTMAAGQPDHQQQQAMQQQTGSGYNPLAFPSLRSSEQLSTHDDGKDGVAASSGPLGLLDRRRGSTETAPSTQFATNEASSRYTHHQKQPSASSISSTSSASTNSKTAAFFAPSSDGTTVRPASMSSSASLVSPSKNTSPPYPYRNLSLRKSLRRSSEEDQDAGPERGAGSSSSMRASTSSSSLVGNISQYSDISRASSSGRKSWVDFDGKPITPLPSPGVIGEMGEGGNLFTFPAAGAASSTAEPSNFFDTSENTPVATQQSSFTLSSFGPADYQARRSGTEATAISPRTSNFFGTSWSAGPHSHNRSETTPREERGGSFTASPTRVSRSEFLDQRRQPTSSDFLHSPSRFPSLSAAHAIPGRGLKPTGLPFSELNLGAPGNGIESPSGPGSPATPRIVLGTQPIVPSAFVSPPSPDPNGSQDESMSFDASSFSPSKNGIGYYKHSHGPSENVTEVSILPASSITHKTYGATGLSSTMDSSVDSKASPRTVMQASPSPSQASSSHGAEESEDEAAGRIGAFNVERVLGVGAFSRVVLAKSGAGKRSENMPGGLVALKMLEREPCQHNERMRVSWVREVEVLKHITHPNIVRFVTSFSTPKHHVLVIEAVEGGELFEYLAEHQLELANREWLVRRLFGELAGAVGWMHTINLVHRDIKLENIILTNNFRSMKQLTPSHLPDAPLLKLSDFGLSRFIDPESPQLETRCGSEEYAAPELIIGKRYDGRKTDVWAMGVVLYALLSGALPFLSVDDKSSANGQGMVGVREAARGDGHGDARARKAHLLRIAKGDLRWPAQTNDASSDVVDPAIYPAQHRLITPPARLLVAKLLRRDAQKRAGAWDVWDEEWMQKGSFGGSGQGESSAWGQIFSPPLDPRTQAGQASLASQARVLGGAPDVVHDD